MTTPDVVAPSTPTGLAAPTVSSTSVVLTWNASTDNVGVTAYDVRRNGNLIGSPSGTTFTDNTVRPNQTYSYTVTARDAVPNLSAASDALSVTASDPDPNLFSDQFTGANGAGWGVGWTTTVNLGTATLQSGIGQLALTDTPVRTAGRCFRAGRTGRTRTRFSYQYNSSTAVAYFSVFTRGSGAWQNGYRPQNGYGLEFSSSSGTVVREEERGRSGDHVGHGHRCSPVSTAKQWVRLRVVGQTIQFKTWVDGPASPRRGRRPSPIRR